MMNRKPETSLQEDLAILGLLSGDAKKALSEEAEDAGHDSGDEDEEGKKDGDADDADDKPKKKKGNPFAKDSE